MRHARWINRIGFVCYLFAFASYSAQNDLKMVLVMSIIAAGNLFFVLSEEEDDTES